MTAMFLFIQLYSCLIVGGNSRLWKWTTNKWKVFSHKHEYYIPIFSISIRFFSWTYIIFDIWMIPIIVIIQIKFCTRIFLLYFAVWWLRCFPSNIIAVAAAATVRRFSCCSLPVYATPHSCTATARPYNVVWRCGTVDGVCACVSVCVVHICFFPHNGS